MRLLLALPLALAAPPAAADGFGFRTPSGNIYCNGMTTTPEIACVIVERDPGSAPIDCPAGRQLEVAMAERGRVTARCGGPGRASTYTDVAAYGVTGRFGRIECRSEQTGFTCTNADGHGFSLSRRSQRVF